MQEREKEGEKKKKENQLKVLQKAGTPLAVQRIRLGAYNAEGADSIPSRGIKIPHATWHGQKIFLKKVLQKAVVKSIRMDKYFCFRHTLKWQKREQLKCLGIDFT